MTNLYARVVDGVVVETCDDAALATHHPDLARDFVKCPSKVRQNWTRTDENNWAPPPSDEPTTTNPVRRKNKSA